MPESKSGALTSLATPHPLQNRELQEPLFRPVVERVLLDSPRDKAAHRIRQLRLEGPRLAFSCKLGEHAGPGTRHARLRTAASQPREVRCHFRMPGRHDRLEVVASKPRKKGRYFD